MTVKSGRSRIVLAIIALIGIVAAGCSQPDQIDLDRDDGAVAPPSAVRDQVDPVEPSAVPPTPSDSVPDQSAQTPVQQKDIVRVPPGFRRAEGAIAEPYTDTGWAQDIVHKATGIEMVYIPAGEFMMGSLENEAGRYDSETQHRVRLSNGFYLGKYEVTQGQWEAVMGNNPSHFKGAGKTAPVERVSWEDCQKFCRKLGAGFRLPTEAEWEYACRAGTTTAFHYGDSFDASMANFNGNHPYGDGQRGEWRRTTVPVGSFRPNAWGLHDMHGNVREWCQDWSAAYPADSVTDPTGPAQPVSGANRVIRGGGWSSTSRRSRSADRGRDTPRRQANNLGLRVLFSPSQASL